MDFPTPPLPDATAYTRRRLSSRDLSERARKRCPAVTRARSSITPRSTVTSRPGLDAANGVLDETGEPGLLRAASLRRSTRPGRNRSPPSPAGSLRVLHPVGMTHGHDRSHYELRPSLVVRRDGGAPDGPVQVPLERRVVSAPADREQHRVRVTRPVGAPVAGCSRRGPSHRTRLAADRRTVSSL